MSKDVRNKRVIDTVENGNHYEGFTVKNRVYIQVLKNGKFWENADDKNEALEDIKKEEYGED